MSADIVDDLHAAEDLIGSVLAAVDAARQLINLGEHGEAYDRLLALAGHLATYCRPSCGDADSDPDGAWDCDPDCGCPADHGHGHDDRSEP